jgi:cytosine/adenosine deaminase-related metal-dependent hydrolase
LRLLLKNVRWVNNGGLTAGDVRIDGARIAEIGIGLTARKNEKVTQMDDHYLYCGLTNSHDHLEMNLYPRMGRPPYLNYTQWAADVYKPDESPVREIERIPIEYRLLCGGIKNLISGVTTVVHHNPWHRSLGNHFPVRVLKRYAWAHSLAFEKSVTKRFPFRKGTPFIIHAAEGIDSLARNEINELKRIGVLKTNSVLIHGVGLGSDEIEIVSRAGSSLVWCPSSNYYMFGRTVLVSQLKGKISVALGTDSLMTGPCTLFEEMQIARQSNEVTAKEILEMVTVVPRKIFGLPEQQILPGFPADFLVVPIKSVDYYENLVVQRSEDITCVLSNGEMLFAEEALATDLSLKGFVRTIGSRSKWLGWDVDQLKKNILSTGINESLLEESALWKLLA